MNQGELAVLEERLQQSNVSIDIVLKRRVFDILLEIQDGAINQQYPMPGMLIVLGYDPQKCIHSRYYSVPDKTQNPFRYADGDLQELPSPIGIMVDEAKERIKSTKDYDGAILIDPTGYVIDTGIYLVGIDPIEVLEEIEVDNDRDLSERFGFVDKVHTRHLTAICASYLMPNTTVYTLSGKTGIIRAFEDGRILYSQNPNEVKAGVIAEKQEDNKVLLQPA